MPQMKINGQDVLVFPDGKMDDGSLQWAWRVGDRCGKANSEEGALFWAGWWTGRRELVDEMAARVGQLPSEINGGGPVNGKLPGQR